VVVLVARGWLPHVAHAGAALSVGVLAAAGVAPAGLRAVRGATGGQGSTPLSGPARELHEDRLGGEAQAPGELLDPAPDLADPLADPGGVVGVR
jgi:hypothetical protein